MTNVKICLVALSLMGCAGFNHGTASPAPHKVVPLVDSQYGYRIGPADGWTATPDATATRDWVEGFDFTHAGDDASGFIAVGPPEEPELIVGFVGALLEANSLSVQYNTSSCPLTEDCRSLTFTQTKNGHVGFGTFIGLRLDHEHSAMLQVVGTDRSGDTAAKTLIDSFTWTKR